MRLLLKDGQESEVVSTIGYHVQVMIDGDDPGTVNSRLVLPEECVDEDEFWAAWRAFGGSPEIEPHAQH